MVFRLFQSADFRDKWSAAIAAISALLCWLPAVHAGPFVSRQLPPGTIWFVHLDLDAARQSPIAAALGQVWLRQPGSALTLEQVRQHLGLDPVIDLHDVTIYGTSYIPDTAVLVLRGRVDHDRLTGLLKILPGYRSEIASGYTLYRWNETDPKRRHESVGSLFGAETIVIAPDSQSVVKQLQVLDEKTPGLHEDSPLTVHASAGTILVAAASGLAEAKSLPIQSPILRQCEYGSIAVGGLQGQMFVEGRVKAQSADIAGKLRALIEGARALGQLQAPDNADLARVLDELQVRSKNASVEFHWEFSATELLKILQKLQEHKAGAAGPEKP